MRLTLRLLLALLLLLPAPAMAAGWRHYVNARYGYGVDVPPGFVGQSESENGDGQVFKTPTAKLTVFGGNIVSGDFEGEVVQQERFAEQDKWGITYQVSTPQNASFSGKRGARILYARMIPLCHGQQFGMFEIEHSSVDLQAFNPIIDRLVGSFAATTNSLSC